MSGETESLTCLPKGIRIASPEDATPELFAEVRSFLQPDEQGRNLLEAAAFKGTFSMVYNNRALTLAARSKTLVNMLLTLLQEHRDDLGSQAPPENEEFQKHILLLMDLCREKDGFSQV